MLGELTEEEISRLLEQQFVGRIACTDGQVPYVVPVSYIFEGASILCHSRDGLKIQMMRANPNVCFEVDDIRDYNHWRTAIAWGVFEELTHPDALSHAQQVFSSQMLQSKTEQSAPTPELLATRSHNAMPASVPTVFYRIHFTKVTGRYEQGL